MNEAAPASLLDVQVDAMLERVSQHRDRRVREIEANTSRETRAIVRGARTEARDNVHQAVVHERARIAQGLQQAEARAELEARTRAQQQTLTLLEHMWELIAAELEQRWRGESSRSAWVVAATENARTLLGARSWRIEYAPGLSAADRRRSEELARAHSTCEIEWQPAPQLRAGLRISTIGACLDATIDGLLVERGDVEAAFLCEYLAAGSAVSQVGAPPAGAQPPPATRGPKP